MAVTEQIPRNVSTATAGATVFPYDFKVLAKGDMLVQVNGVTKTVDVDFTLSGVGLDAGGNITFSTPFVGGEVVMRKREMTLSRTNDFQSLGDLRSPTLNNDQDAPIMMLQQINEALLRSIRLPLDSTASAQLPPLVPLAPLVVKADGTGFAMGSTALTGDMLLRGNLADSAAGKGADLVADAAKVSDLASTASGKGAELVGFKQAGTGAVARTLLDKAQERVSVFDFIPVTEHAAIRAFTSTYDCTSAITAAYSQAKAVHGTLVFPAGLFCVASTITLDGTAGFVGEGCSGANLDLETITTLTTTLFRWVGAAGGTVINQTGRIGGIDVGNFAVDCNNLADIGVCFDRLTYSRILPLKVVAWRANQTGKGGLVIKPNPAFAADNFMFNDFAGLYLRGPTCCLRLTTFNGASGNTCHCTFRQIIADCRGGTVNNGIVIDDADNNSFLMSYTSVLNYPTDYGLSLEGSAARSNYFWHFQGAINAKAGSKNAVFGFDRENGQPQPTVAAGAELFWTETGNNAQFWNMTVPLRNCQAVIEGNISTSGLGVDPSRFSLVRKATNSVTYFGYSAGGVLQIYHSADGSAVAGPPIQIGNNRLGFFGASVVSKPAVSGSRGGNAALASLLTQLASLGLITDSSSA